MHVFSPLIWLLCKYMTAFKKSIKNTITQNPTKTQLSVLSNKRRKKTSKRRACQKKKLFSYSAIQNRDFIKNKPKSRCCNQVKKIMGLRHLRFLEKEGQYFLRTIDLLWNPEFRHIIDVYEGGRRGKHASLICFLFNWMQSWNPGFRHIMMFMRGGREGKGGW